MRAKFALAACALLAFAAPGVASDANLYSGEQLFQDCTSTHPSHLPNIACGGYAVGISDVLAGGNTVNGFKACPPASVTRGQVIKVVTAYLQQHPDGRHFAAAGLVANALADAFPCPK